MIDAGMNVVSSLVILEQQTSDAVLADVIAAASRGRRARPAALRGDGRATRKVFSRLYVAMVEAGEAAGILDIVLDRVALQIEKEQQIKRRVKGAMVYPMIVLDLRDARPDRDAALPRPDLRQDLRRSCTASCRP